MKNKINKSIRLATLLLATSFLNSCGSPERRNNPMKNDITSTSKKRKMESQVELNGKLSHDQYETEKPDQLCYKCNEGRLGVFRLSNDASDLVLLCEECSSIWLDPDKLGWGNTASDKVLESHFRVNDSEDLFQKGSGWATKEEIEKYNNKKWANLLEINKNKIVIEDIE